MSLSLVKATPARFSECVDFILPREHRCITLAGNLVRHGEPFFLPDTVKEFEILEATGEDGNRRIEGLILVTQTGILLHCLAENVDCEGFAPIVRKFLGETTVRCIIGKTEDTLWLESLILIQPDRAVDYRLMVLDVPPPETLDRIPDLGPGHAAAVFVRGKPSDAERLMELQEGYEREEVMPPGDPFNRNTCQASLTRNLGSQIVFFIRSGREILAKAGTNARGFRWDQLGGVYTRPEWRGKGLATALVAHLACQRMAEDRKIALFVKIKNEPAIRAYEKAGFKADVGFRISYF